MANAPQRKTYPKSHHLLRGGQFTAVYGARSFKHAGPLRVHARPNGLDHHRLGLSISRAVGNAVVRNRLKRIIREAFRLLQHELPGRYDLVVTSRRHEPLTLEAYMQHLRQACDKLHRHWSRSC